MQRLGQADLGRIASLVKKVTFVAPSIFSKVQLGLVKVYRKTYTQGQAHLCMPSIEDALFVEPPEGWMINLENFQTTLLHQPIRRLAKHPWIQTWQWASGFLYPEIDKYGVKTELSLETRDSHLDGQVRRELEKNHGDAQAARDFLLGDDIIAAWTTVLRALSHLRKWHIATFSRACGPDASSYFYQRPKSMGHPEDHGEKYQCHTYDEHLGDALFVAAIGSLSKADAKPHELIVDCVMTGHFGWETLPGWLQLDLTQLHSFRFQPAVDFCRIRDDEFIAPRAANAIAAVLRKCKDSLQELTYKRDCSLQWPGSEIINLPELRCLVLDECWLHQAPQPWQVDGQNASTARSQN